MEWRRGYCKCFKCEVWFQATNLANVVFDFCNLLPTMILNYCSFVKYKVLLKAKVNKNSMHEAKLFCKFVFSFRCKTVEFRLLSQKCVVCLKAFRIQLKFKGIANVCSTVYGEIGFGFGG